MLPNVPDIIALADKEKDRLESLPAVPSADPLAVGKVKGIFFINKKLQEKHC
jgi:hypothetical protein